MKITKISNGRRIENSLQLISLNVEIDKVFKFPKIILLYNHNEYAPQRITPNAPRIQLKTLVL